MNDWRELVWDACKQIDKAQHLFCERENNQYIPNALKCEGCNFRYRCTEIRNAMKKLSELLTQTI